MGPTKRGKGNKWMGVVDGHGIPLVAWVASATPSEVRLARFALERIAPGLRPKRAIGDKAYDSDPLDEELQEELGIELIAPHRSSRKVKIQDGRPLRRYRRRWLVERLFAWLGNFRRVVVRWERHVYNYEGFVTLAVCVILLRHI